jgi:hypothetical protein
MKAGAEAVTKAVAAAGTEELGLGTIAATLNGGCRARRDLAP